MSSSSTSSKPSVPSFPPSSSGGSTMRPVRRAAVVTHGVTANVDEAVARLRARAQPRRASSSLAGGRTARAEIAVVLGGDGTMLRALARFLGTGVPVIGANFGRVGFLAAIPGDELEAGIARVFAGEYAVQSLPTLEVEVGGCPSQVAVNDAVVVSGDARPDRRARLRVERRGSRHAALRRADLRDPAGLDRVQPLERRPGARLGARRGGDHVRRAAHAARAAARRRARLRARRSSTAPPTSRRSCSSTASRSGALDRDAGGHGALRPEPQPARDAARADVLRPLRERLRRLLTGPRTAPAPRSATAP